MNLHVPLGATKFEKMSVTQSCIALSEHVVIAGVHGMFGTSVCEKVYDDLRVCLNLLKLRSLRRYIVAMSIKLFCSVIYRCVRKITKSENYLPHVRLSIHPSS
jgi:hypothetical protein